MRAITTILLFLFFLNSKTVFSQNKFWGEIGLDPKMLVRGPYENADSALDLLVKFGIKKPKVEYNVYGEFFKATQFYSYGVGAMYPYILTHGKDTHIEIAGGADIGLITRPEYKITCPTFSLNAELRLKIEDHFYIKYLANYRYRSDLKEIYNSPETFRYSGYFLLGYQFTL